MWRVPPLRDYPRRAGPRRPGTMWIFDRGSSIAISIGGSPTRSPGILDRAIVAREYRFEQRAHLIDRVRHPIRLPCQESSPFVRGRVRHRRAAQRGEAIRQRAQEGRFEETRARALQPSFARRCISASTFVADALGPPGARLASACRRSSAAGMASRPSVTERRFEDGELRAASGRSKRSRDPRASTAARAARRHAAPRARRGRSRRDPVLRRVPPRPRGWASASPGCAARRARPGRAARSAHRSRAPPARRASAAPLTRPPARAAPAARPAGCPARAAVRQAASASPPISAPARA